MIQTDVKTAMPDDAPAAMPKYQALLELRPALDGYAGIPQETRLLFRGLCLSQNVQVTGLLQTSHRYLSAGLAGSADEAMNSEPAARFHRMARVIISLESAPVTTGVDGILRYLKKKQVSLWLAIASVWWPERRKIGLSRFIPSRFEDYLWRHLFARTLPADDFALVTAQGFRVCGVPWNILHTAGMESLRFSKKPTYPILDTRGFDFFIAQTPYPARVTAGTTLIVRYHDAFPVFMPHTVAHRSRHEATHFHALSSNVASGAYFACVSESSRQDLLAMYPDLGERAVTIPNMVSHHFHDAPTPATHVPAIIRARVNRTCPEASPVFGNLEPEERFYQQHLKQENLSYLLAVSTIEPRKNHERLIAAWERIRAEHDPNLKLVLVGNFGWDFSAVAQSMRSWIDQGALFALNNVPAEDLRQLYQHAAATVCPSLAEGFDFSGVESMKCGGVAIASDIAVHREVYGDAAEYFDPYSTDSLTSAINKVIYEHGSNKLRDHLRTQSKLVSERYLPENILPLWDGLFGTIRTIRQSRGSSLNK